MRKLSVLKIWLLVVATAVFAACAGETPAPTTASPATQEPVAAEPTATEEPTVAPTEAPTEEPTTEPTETPTVEPTATVDVQELTANLTDECVESYDPEVDYFPQKADVEYAENFTIEYFNHYKVVTVLTPFQGAADPVQYVLVQCGTPAPEGYDETLVVEVPIDSIISMSTSYLPYLDRLGKLDTLVALDSFAFPYNENVRALIAEEALVEVGGGAEVNVEQVLDLEPDLVMTYSSGSPDFDAGPKLREVGVPVALNAEFMDATPLGRTEWMDFIAAFYNEEAQAETIFSEIATEYNDLKALAETADSHPSVFLGAPFEGTWYMAGGDSFAAQLLADAGAAYVYADDTSAQTLFLDFETVFNDAADAGYWLNVGFYATLDDLKAADERFADFNAFQQGNVYNNDARTNENGGNDYFESGVANPHVVLADLIKIFHPDLLPDHEFVYYRQME